jgi:hypothetical protein
VSDQPEAYTGSSENEQEGKTEQASPELVLEELGKQAAEAALFPSTLREEYFFAYDLLISQATISRFVKGLRPAKIARLPHFKLIWPYFYTPAGSALPTLTRTNNLDDEVWGLLYDARKKDFIKLESYLKIPNRYHRRSVHIQDRGDRRFTAFTYVLSASDGQLHNPSASYRDELVAACRERNMPEEWVDYLNSLATDEQQALGG